MAQYEPEPTPSFFKDDDLQTAMRYMQSELQRISNAFSAVENVVLPMLFVEPAKKTQGIVVLADGTAWNPGSGKGFYGYNGTAWVFLG